VLLPYAENDPEAKSHLSAITQELKRLGWSQDRNIRIEARFAAMPDQFPALAADSPKLPHCGIRSPAESRAVMSHIIRDRVQPAVGPAMSAMPRYRPSARKGGLS
jgi:hypothetical protein